MAQGTCDTAVILMGGQSRRMGYQEKYKLHVAGKRMIDRVIGCFEEFPLLFLSVNGKQKLENLPYLTVVDEFSGIGPMGGICTALRQIKSPTTFVASCDLPFLTSEIVTNLSFSFDTENHDCAVAVVAGRVHPLCGVYAQSMLPALEKSINKGHYRLMDVLEQVRVQYVHFPESYAKYFANINTEEQYELLQKECHPKVRTRAMQ